MSCFIIEIGLGDTMNELGFADSQIAAQGNHVPGTKQCAQFFAKCYGFRERITAHIFDQGKIEKRRTAAVCTA
jgi:hypothetical protein